MKVTVYQAPFRQTCEGYSPEADYEAVWSETLQLDDLGNPPEHSLLESLWTRYQRVDEETGPWPPEGYEARSLSIGDLVEVVFEHDAEVMWWSPVSVGWERVFIPPAALARAAALRDAVTA